MLPFKRTIVIGQSRWEHVLISASHLITLVGNSLWKPKERYYLMSNLNCGPVHEEEGDFLGSSPLQTQIFIKVNWTPLFLLSVILLDMVKPLFLLPGRLLLPWGYRRPWGSKILVSKMSMFHEDIGRKHSSWGLWKIPSFLATYSNLCLSC